MKKYNLYLLLAALLCFVSCRDIIEEDISGKSVSVITPTNNLQSPIYTQLFRWNAVDGALNYRIQVVTPSFQSVQTLICDTTVTTTQITKILDPGTYQWKIYAANGNYQTSAQLYNLVIVESPLNLQTVTLLTPTNGTYVRTPGFNFTWEAVHGATKYIIQIDTALGNYNPPLKTDEIDATTSYAYGVPFEGNYKWRLKAQDDAGDETPWSSGTYLFSYFSSPPLHPTPLSPSSGATTASPVTFTWSAASDNRADKYNVYIYKNADTTTTPEKHTVSGVTSASIPFVPTSQTIYWRVSATDKAGNESVLTAPAWKLVTQ